MPHNLAGQIILEDMFSAPLSSLARLSQQAEAALRQMGGTVDTAAGTAANKIQNLEASLDALKQKAQSGGAMSVLDVSQFRAMSAELARLKKTMEAATTVKVDTSQAVLARQRVQELERELDALRAKGSGGSLSVGDVSQFRALSAELARLKGSLDSMPPVKVDTSQAVLARQRVQELERELDALRAKGKIGALTVGDAGQIRRVSGELRNLKSVMGETEEAGRSLAQQLAGMAGINLGPLAGGLTAAAVAFVAMKVAAGTVDLYKLGAQATRMENAFKSMAASVGSSSDEMLTSLRNASRGTISDMDLMLSANRAMMLGVTNDAATMGRLLEVAIARGQAIGRSPLEAFDDIAVGIGRMSGPILDNLGILTGGEQAFKAYAESIGKTADALTDVEKRQFLVNKVLADTTPLAEDAQMGTEQLGAAWRNFINEAGTELAVGGGDLGIPTILDRMTAMGRLSREAREAFDQLGISVLEMAGSAIGISLGSDQLNQWAATYRDIARMAATGDVRKAAEDWAQLKMAMEATTAVNAAPTFEGVADVLRELTVALPAVAASFQVGTREATLFAQTLARVGAEAGSAAKASALGMVEYVGEPDALRLYRERQAAVEEYVRSNSRMGRSNDQIEFGLRNLRDGWERYDEAIRRATTADERKVSSTQALRSALTGLDSKIRTALTAGMEVTPGDMFASQAGTYRDGAMESARRLNAIAQRGFAELSAHPDWAGLLKIPPEVLGGSEEQLRAWAASTSAAVQDLSRPDLINWDAFIANFQSQLDKEQAQKLTLDIAVNKLDEAGLLAGLGGDEQARRDKVAEALGLKAPKITLEALLEADKNAGANFLSEVYPPSGVAAVPATLAPASATVTPVPLTAPGTTMAGGALAGSLYAGFTETLAGQDVGMAVVTAWSTSLTAKKSLEGFGTIGTTLGTTVAGAFVLAMKDGVGNVRRDMAAIVAPEVAKILASQQPRTNLP